ncbi:hypothetical protein BJB45_12830 [Halomonas huangheensis]|uniref:Uncharacterized protein n=1 Tax=Halomonas huangheensis TaxID=1178482 RepID=W1N807_9GAMM|nr:hypothetical protein AR456_14290 [Halomonas huangheensis]ERL51668.1 hypothetical protein BJB45_12830 [Halomonas huangheensis]
MGYDPKAGEQRGTRRPVDSFLTKYFSYQLVMLNKMKDLVFLSVTDQGVIQEKSKYLMLHG